MVLFWFSVASLAISCGIFAWAIKLFRIATDEARNCKEYLDEAREYTRRINHAE